MTNERIFTLAEARATVPAVNDLLADIQPLRRRLSELRATAEAVRRTGGSNGGAVWTNTRNLESRMRKLVHEMQDQVAQIQALGAQIKDIDQGLVDWITEREGERVMLCWRRGEATIEWWHRISDGVAGRRPIVADEWP